MACLPKVDSYLKAIFWLFLLLVESRGPPLALIVGIFVLKSVGITVEY